MKKRMICVSVDEDLFNKFQVYAIYKNSKPTSMLSAYIKDCIDKYPNLSITNHEDKQGK